MLLGSEQSGQCFASAFLWLLRRWERLCVEGGCVVLGLREGRRGLM